MMRVSAVKRRIRFEINLMALLLAVLAGLILFRLPTRIGQTFGKGVRLQWKPGHFVTVEYGEGTSNAIDAGRLSDPWTKNSADLVVWAQMAWENQWGYVWGTYGNVLDEGLLSYKLEQYPSGVGDYEGVIRDKWLDRRTADCIGLIKGYGWYDPGRGEICYGTGDMVDCGTDGMYDAAQVKGPIDTLPETPGVLLYAPGHVGIYIGNGYGIEAISTAGGVVKTKVADRPWTNWMECPYISYD